MEKENREILIKGAEAFGIQLNQKVVEGFEIYLKELVKWNQKINLTAIKSEKDIVIKHFLDSLSIIPYLTSEASLLDIGSGPGFPGIPVKMVLPSIMVTLIDSRLKKVDFQKHIIRKLGLKGITPIHGRIEDKLIVQNFEGQFDLAVSRAFSGIENLLTLGYPYLKKGALLFAMKGKLKKEKFLIEYFVNGGIKFLLKDVIEFILPFSQFHRSILIFEKL